MVSPCPRGGSYHVAKFPRASHAWRWLSFADYTAALPNLTPLRILGEIGLSSPGVSSSYILTRQVLRCEPGPCAIVLSPALRNISM